MKYTESGRLTGSIGGGALGGFSGAYFTCNIFFGIETAGTSLLWCGLVAGGLGAYAGGTAGGSSFEFIGEKLYEVIENE